MNLPCRALVMFAHMLGVGARGIAANGWRCAEGFRKLGQACLAAERSGR
jgi:hypothetical protein